MRCISIKPDISINTFFFLIILLFCFLVANTPNTPVNNTVVNNIRAPQTPAVPNNNQAEGTVTVHHQNGPITLPVEEQLPNGYVEIYYICNLVFLFE